MVFKTKPGWANTNKNWLKFEKDVDFETNILKIKWYNTENENIIFNWEKVWEFYKNHWFYKKFLEPKWIYWDDIISKKILPDTAIYILQRDIVYIIEVKSQWGWWSVDEKLETCRFKKTQYKRLLENIWLDAQFYFILDNYFLHPKYKDVLNFIRAEWCDYFFWEIPLHYLELPIN